MTVLECFTWILTCGKAMAIPDEAEDQYIVDFNERMAKKEEEEAAAQVEQEKLDLMKQETDLRKQKNSAFGPTSPQADETQANQEEDQALLQKNEDEENLLKERGCCMRIICLICCCVTKDLGSQSQLNGLKQEEIELYR